MKGKFGIVALLVSSITFAGPVSAPNNLSDTPIISGGGTVSGGGACRAYQTNGTAVSLSGGETLVFYGGGMSYTNSYCPKWYFTSGGYLSTKSNYSGTAYVRVKGYEYYNRAYRYPGGAIGLFAQNTDSKNDFIAGAGSGGYELDISCGWGCYCRNPGEPGGGWSVVRTLEVFDYPPLILYADVYQGNWFTSLYGSSPGFNGVIGFNEIGRGVGGASSISAFYNSYTKNYTSFQTSLTISGGGYAGQRTPTLYVCR